MEVDNTPPTVSKFLLKFEKCFRESKIDDECFLKGCKWSPDGLCLLTASEDNFLRLFEVTQIILQENEDKNPVLEYREGGTIYDYAWYPSMSSNDPSSCVFASTSRNAPIHLWDAYTGELRATYQPINQYDEVHSANSLCFSPGGKIYSGFKKEIKIFDLSLPGREFEKISLKGGYQTGIISCFAFNAAVPSLYAVGSYDKSVGLYTEPSGELQCLLQAHRGGVTHLAFSPDGTRLYSGGRKDFELLCWDLRNPGTVLFTVLRNVNTSQRIYFDLTPDGHYLFTGSTSGDIAMYDTKLTPSDTGYLNPLKSWQAHLDCANGVSVNPNENTLATASGQRHAKNTLWSDDDDDDASIQDSTTENCVKIWDFQCI